MRKNAAMLKSTPVKLDKVGKDFIARVKAMAVVPGCEAQHERYLAAVIAAEEASARYDVIYRQVEKEGGTSSCKSWPAFVAAGDEHSRKAHQAFGALDAYLYAAKHVDDPKDADQEELRAVIAVSLNTNMDGLKFSMNYGLLGAKVAQAIRADVTAEEFTDIPYCQDHA